MRIPDTHSAAGIAAMAGLIGLCAAYPATFTPLTFATGAGIILGGIAGTTAAKAYQTSVTPPASQPEVAPVPLDQPK